MPNSRLRFVAVPLVIAMMLAGKVLPASWSNEYPLLLATIIAVIGTWVGIETWRAAKAQNA
ncbi:MAG: hypothetical protein K2P79_04070 [Sphingomonas sp.]|nr:hypothetical protein [Sphingomonas sp.]